MLPSVTKNNNPTVALNTVESPTRTILKNNNNNDVVGLISVKDQLRIIFDIIDTKRTRKWYKHDCLKAMAINGIARKLIASIPILALFLYPSKFNELFNNIV